MGRYGKMTVGAGNGGYNPPSYSGDYYSYADKSRDEGREKRKTDLFFKILIV